MIFLVHKLKKDTFHFIMAWGVIFVFLFALQPNFARAASCLDETNGMTITQHFSPDYQQCGNDQSKHNQADRFNNCCNLGLSFSILTSTPNFEPFHQQIYASNFMIIYDGVMIETQVPPPRFNKL